jgi:uncharacterized protein YndB with AHSA1/START domain
MLRKVIHSLKRERGTLVYMRELVVPAAADRVFRVVQGIGGQRGWMFANYLWRLRGNIDRWLGGVGMSRPRRDPDELCVGDVVDFWRVQALRRDRFIRFAAEMKLPGKAWLQFEFVPEAAGETRLRSSALFKPDGMWGLLYWLALYPAHVFLFSGMLRAIAAAAEAGLAGSHVIADPASDYSRSSL